MIEVKKLLEMQFPQFKETDNNQKVSIADILEKMYQETLKKYDPTREFLVSSGAFVSTISGSSGMKMNGPYEYVPPVDALAR